MKNLSIGTLVRLKKEMLKGIITTRTHSTIVCNWRANGTRLKIIELLEDEGKFLVGAAQDRESSFGRRLKVTLDWLELV